MSRIKRWLDMQDRLPELSDAVQDDPRILDEQPRSSDQLARRDAFTLKDDASFHSVADQEPF